MMIITEEQKARIRELASHGLDSGMGVRAPGETCAEGVVAWALDLEHTDQIPCVAGEDRAFVIRLNDAPWSSKQARYEGMIELMIAQLGTARTDRSAWLKRVVEGVIRRVLPMALRAAAKVQGHAEHKAALKVAAARCERDGDEASARAAAEAAFAISAEAEAEAEAARRPPAAARAARNAANAAANAATDAAYAAAYAIYDAGALAANDVAAAAAFAAAAAKDTVLREAAAVALDAYRAET